MKAIAISEKVLAPNHPSFATAYNNIALIYKAMGEYDKALEFALKSITINEQILAPNHPSLATSYNNIAVIYQEMGEYDKALEFASKSKRQ